MNVIQSVCVYEVVNTTPSSKGYVFLKLFQQYTY